MGTRTRTRTGLVAAVLATAVVATGCGGAGTTGAPTPASSTGPGSPTPSASGSPTPAPDPAAVEALLALAQLTDEAVGYPRDNKYERSNLVRGITDTSQPHCRDAVASDEHRITRVGRAWMSRGWASGDGPKVYVHLDLVAYRDDKRAKAAVQELATVPKKCPKLISPSGGNREHYAEPVIDQPDLVAVVATVEHPNGVTTYEATYALAAAAVVSYLTVKTTDPDSIASLSRRLAQKVGVATGRAGARVAPLLRGATV